MLNFTFLMLLILNYFTQFIRPLHGDDTDKSPGCFEHTFLSEADTPLGRKELTH